MIPTTQNSGKDKTMETVKNISGCQRLGEGRMNKWSTEVFWGSENTLYDTIVVDTCHYMFVKTHRMYNAKNEPEC